MNKRSGCDMLEAGDIDQAMLMWVTNSLVYIYILKSTCYLDDLYKEAQILKKQNKTLKQA